MIPFPLVASLALLSATAPFATDMYLPVMPAIVADLDTTRSMVQLTISGFFIGMGADGVDVAGNGGPLGGDFRGLETLGAIDMAESTDAGDRAEINELDLVFSDDDVGRFQVVVDHAACVEVIQSGEDLQDVRNRSIDREDVILLVVAAVLE